MGVYIKGMEMPITGLYFVSVDNTDGRDKTIVTVERMLGNRDVRQIVGSFEAVPVPPHGDLIDRNALLEGEGRYLISLCKEGIDVEEILRAKTVIPANTEEEKMK